MATPVTPPVAVLAEHAIEAVALICATIALCVGKLSSAEFLMVVGYSGLGPSVAKIRSRPPTGTTILLLAAAYWAAGHKAGPLLKLLGITSIVVLLTGCLPPSACSTLPGVPAVKVKAAHAAADHEWTAAGWPLPDRCARYDGVLQSASRYLARDLCPVAVDQIVGCYRPDPWHPITIVAALRPQDDVLRTIVHERFHHMQWCALAFLDTEHSSPSVWGPGGMLDRAEAHLEGER